jgi:chromate transporter
MTKTVGNDDADLAVPRSLGDLFWSFSMLALQGFGGVLAVTQRELVERKRWLSRQGFLEDWAVAQTLPGPNVGNLAILLGDRYMGMPGAFAAIAGLFFFPLLILLALAIFFASVSHLPEVQGTLRGMGVVVAALIVATGFKLMAALRTHPGGILFCAIAGAATFFSIAVMHWALIWVLLCVGGLSCVWTYLRLKSAPSATGSKQ